jgi:hypothetical protein
MFRKLLRTDDIEVAEQMYSVRYYEAMTLRGVMRYSSEIVIGPADRIILDDSSLSDLESKVARLAPATIYSRLLVARATAA